MIRPFGKLFVGLFDDPAVSPPLVDDATWPIAGPAVWEHPGTNVTSSLADARRGSASGGIPQPVTMPVALPGEPASPTPFTVNIVWDSSVGLAPAGFTGDILAAVNFLETQFTDPITITIDVGYGEVAGNALGRGDLGESLANLSSVTYADLVSAAAASATTATDAAVAASLPAAAPIAGANYWITSAQGKALGLSAADNGAADGSVGFGPASDFTYGDTNAGGTVAAGTYDFFATAVHEMTEVMGRQMLTGSAEYGSPNSYTLLDLLHWSAPGTRDLSQLTPGYFSTDGGITNLGAFNTVIGGDAGDWALSVSDNSFDAYAAPGAFEAVTTGDLTEIDALGWRPASTSGSAPPVTVPTSPAAAPPVFAPVALPVFSTLTSPFFPVFSPFSPFLPYTATTPARPTNAPVAPSPSGVSFAPEPRYLAYTPGNGGLSAGSPLAAVGGAAADGFSYTLGGTGATAFTLLPTASGAALLAGSGGVAGASGGELYPLTVTATDETAPGNPSTGDPVNVVVAGNGNAIVHPSSFTAIVTSAPTFIFCLSGNDALDATGISGPLYFDAAAGGDTMTGGNGTNVFEYGAISGPSGSAADIITNFNVAVDLIDLTGSGAAFNGAAALAPSAGAIAAGSIGWQTSGGDTYVYANTSQAAAALTAASLTIELRGNIGLTSANFVHS